MERRERWYGLLSLLLGVGLAASGCVTTGVGTWSPSGLGGQGIGGIGIGSSTIFPMNRSFITLGWGVLNRPGQGVSGWGWIPGKGFSSGLLSAWVQGRTQAERERQRCIDEDLKRQLEEQKKAQAGSGQGRTPLASSEKWCTSGGWPGRTIRDLNGDGRPDLIRFYDQAGQLIREEEDTDLDGWIDTWTVFINGQPVRKEADTDGDGRSDFWITYDAQGRPSRTESDTDRDGRPDLIGYYKRGLLLREERYNRWGRLVAVTVYEEGRPAWRKESTGGGDHRDRITFFDKRGQVIREEEDIDGDGEIDIVSYYQNGRLIRRELFHSPLLR